MEKFHTGATTLHLSGFVAPSSAQKLDSMEQVAGSSTPAPGPNALPFGTPVATGAAQVLCFVASPLVRATALPAPEADALLPLLGTLMFLSAYEDFPA
jgi:hypothetical protein